MIIPHDVAVGQTIEIAAPCKLMILGVRNYTHGGSAPIQVIELALDDGVAPAAPTSDDEPEAPHVAEESDDATDEAQGDDEGQHEAEGDDEADAT
jgi:hypothetical protein